MDGKLNESWKQKLQQELQQPYFLSLIEFIRKEYAEETCYPQWDSIFSAFDHCSFESTQVVIIGQDPYHGPNQANGLCFSVKDGISHPPSLINIFRRFRVI